MFILVAINVSDGMVWYGIKGYKRKNNCINGNNKDIDEYAVFQFSISRSRWDIHINGWMRR